MQWQLAGNSNLLPLLTNTVAPCGEVAVQNLDYRGRLFPQHDGLPEVELGVAVERREGEVAQIVRLGREPKQHRDLSAVWVWQVGEIRKKLIQDHDY